MFYVTAKQAARHCFYKNNKERFLDNRRKFLDIIMNKNDYNYFKNMSYDI